MVGVKAMTGYLVVMTVFFGAGFAASCINTMANGKTTLRIVTMAGYLALLLWSIWLLV